MVIPVDVLRSDAEAALAVCDGLLFPGGPDVTPWYYGEEPLPVIDIFEPDADDAWLKAGQVGLKRKIPMFGCCRGIQLLNVLMGGSLYQDVQLQGKGIIQHMQKFDRSYLTHHVNIEADTHLAGILGQGEHKVNSIHHQCVKVPGKGMRISAYAPDGTIEGIEDEEGLIIGVQWHPENLVDSNPEMNKLFKYLVDTAAKRAGKAD